MKRPLSYVSLGFAMLSAGLGLGCVGGSGDEAAAHVGGAAGWLGTGGSFAGTSALGGSAPQVGGGACVAPQQTCAFGCVDTTSNDQNCGACGVACAAGQHCAAGKCECAAGTSLCGATCANLMTDAAHCGSCEQACPTGGMCVSGHCAGADGCNGPASDISVSGVIAYQTVAIALMKDGQPVSSANRNADLAAGRDTLVRVLVTPGASFVPHEISARIHLTKAGAPLKDVFVKATPQGASTIEKLSSSFNLTLPKDLVQADASYSVELAECAAAAPAGTAMAARFPATGETPLDARTTGVLKLKFLPLQVSGDMPDISDTRLAYYKSFFEALYPITELQFTVGNVRQLNGQPNFDNLLDDMRDVRMQEQPADDVYYVAVSPVPSSEGSADGIGFDADADEPDYRVCVTTSNDDDEYSSLVMGHEVGHNHGLEHSPGCGAGDPDQNYPYAGGHLGSWGIDRRHPDKLIDPSKAFDLMTYCEPVWFSDYTYQPILKRVAHLNGHDFHIKAGSIPKTDWRVLIAPPSDAPHWGHPYNGRTPHRTPEPATVLDSAGNPVAAVNVYRIRTTSDHATTFVVPVPSAGWAAIQISGLPVVSF